MLLQIVFVKPLCQSLCLCESFAGSLGLSEGHACCGEGKEKDHVFYRVSQKKVSTKNFLSELLTTSIHSFEFIWIQNIRKFCLVYHLKDLGSSR